MISMSRANLEAARPLTSGFASWSAVALAGFLAALAWLLWRFLASWWVGQTPVLTLRWIASLVLGEDATQAVRPFGPQIVGVSVAVHLGLSFLYACMLAPLLKRLGMARALSAGVAFGALLYAVNFHVFAPTLFPWMTELRGGITFISHLLFGLVLAYTYKTAEAAERKSLRGPKRSE
jgi:hypothetical protein